MVKIQVNGLQIALAAAEQIYRLEAVKDRLKDVQCRISAGGPSGGDPLAIGCLIDIDIRQDQIRATVDRMLADNHKILSDLGIELTP